ncbi:MAG: polysaccharide deacetylase family protein [Oscillospiraceae bacterium]|jgi:peptidoglycan/xylan/chitin deacetylase (PgdA/CDA1 family)|nr:polysaccharide deacetylase family protein [Oscillospiraceae bacterium]
MSAKRWFVMLFSAAVLVLLSVAAANFIIDPFGVFGDRAFDWYAFDMTENPRAAKLAYIDAHHDEYDAYLIGPSGTSSLSPEVLNEYTGYSWYNCFNYGADLAYSEALAEYLTQNYEVRALMLTVPYVSACQYDLEPESITDTRHPNITGNAADWLRFLFANPRYSAAKLRDYLSNSYLQEVFDVFVPETGVYDKSSRDVEPIGSMDAYLEAYPVFTHDYPDKFPMTQLEACMDALERIKALCDSRGIELTVLVPPMPESQLNNYFDADLEAFYTRLGEITPYHDFARLAPNEPRYFYDENHYRNNVGEMMLARIYDDSSVYIPGPEEDIDTQLRVLLYHHIVEAGETNADTMLLADFRRDMEAIRDSGYTTVGISDLEAYVNDGVPLPERAVLIRFDDGYLSNYTLAYPVLQEFGFKAVIFAIGVSIGHVTYKDTDTPITPHFSYEQAREMVDSGLVEVQSHTWDMHQVESLDGLDCRRGLLRRENESEDEYVAALSEDFIKSRAGLETGTGQPVTALAYPYGLHDLMSLVVLSRLGVKVTFTTEAGINTLVKGLPQSLYNLSICAISDLT